MNKYFLTILISFSILNFISGQPLTQRIITENFKVGDVVDEKYSAFGLGEWEKDDQLAYYVKHIEAINEFKLICFVRNIPCNPILCPEELEFFLLKDNFIQDRKSLLFNREDSPNIEILHNTFIQYTELQHNWFENDNGVMDYDKSEDFVASIRLVIKEGKLLLINELPKSDLRIYRNLIFAKYGYVFKSVDLNNLFTLTRWYNPKPDININELLNKNDKDLISYIQKLEPTPNKK